MSAILGNAWFLNSFGLVLGVGGGIVAVSMIWTLLSVLVKTVALVGLAAGRYAARGEVLTYWFDQSQRADVLEISKLKPYRITLARKGKGLEDIWPSIKTAQRAAPR